MLFRSEGMGVEIERKFLPSGDGWRACATARTLLRQGYLANNERCSVRVRVAGGDVGALLAGKGVELRACPVALPILREAGIPEAQLKAAVESDWYEEFLAPIIAVKVVDGLVGNTILASSKSRGFIGLTFYDSGARSFYAKKARGMMARHIIKHRLTEVTQLTGFNEAGYYFVPQESDDRTLMFKRAEN